MKKRNQGTIITVLAWLLSAVVVPSLPEWMNGQSLFSYPFMEYGPTIGMFALILLIVWIPIGIRVSKIYRAEGIRKVLLIVIVAFSILIIVWLLIFRFLWNS